MQKIQLEKSLSEGFIFYAISTLTIAIQFLFYLIHSPRLAMMDVGGWMFYITAACSHAALWALIPYIVSLIVAITVRRHQAADGRRAARPLHARAAARPLAEPGAGRQGRELLAQAL